MPHCEVRWWPANTQNGVKELIRKTYPDVPLVTSKKALEQAKQDCDILINGSGADILQKKMIEWKTDTGKPFGIFGISINSDAPGFMDRVNESAFCYFRDSHSLKYALELGADPKIVKLGLDTAFGVRGLTNDKKAQAFLDQSKLEEGKFLCVIPRWRWSPFWKMRNDPVNLEKEKIDQAYKIPDQQYLLEAIIEVIRQTDMKILICPEDLSQIELGRETLYNPLPDNIKKRVVLREQFWLPDEAISVFSRSAGLFGNEMHSPILCINNDVPAIVCRFKEQGQKGYMWDDIGLGDWLFDIDKPEDRPKIVPAVLDMAKHPDVWKHKARKARIFVEKRFATLMGDLKDEVRKA